jgi:hypothetical protein
MLCAIAAVVRKLASGTSRKAKRDHHFAVAAEGVRRQFTPFIGVVLFRRNSPREARKFVALGGLHVAVRIVAIVDAVSGRKSSKVVHCMRGEIQIVAAATDMVSPRLFHASSCDAADIDSHPKPCGRGTGADATATAISLTARFGGREHA